jgi:ubiquinone/menaquinone biosynthesis C-methylase UbiE
MPHSGTSGEKMEEKELANSFDKGAVDYDKVTTTFHHRISEYVLYTNLEKEISNYKNPKILDAGCGTGKIAIKLLRKGFNLTLLDISKKSLDIAKDKITKENLNTEYYLGSCEKTSFADKSFDIVMLNGAVISYTLDPEKLLNEVHRILKDDGMIWFDFFNNVGWAIETIDLNLKYEIASSDNKLIQMPDWDYPARVMSLRFVRELVTHCGYKIIDEYGLINLSHSINLETRYEDNVPEETVNKYKTIELRFSHNKEMIGSAWSCIIAAGKCV